MALWVAVALADPDAPPREYQAWEALYDARLAEAQGLAPAAALEAYRKVEGDTTDPTSLLYGEVRYWVALAALETGDIASAHAALDEISRVPDGLSDRTRLLRARVQAQERGVRQLPYRQDFEGAESPAPWVLSWTRSDESALSVETLPDGNQVVAWQTTVRKGEDDSLLLPFQQTVRGPENVRMDLLAAQFPARVRLLLEDDEGQQWSSRVLLVGTDDWVTVSLALGDFALVGDPRSGRKPDPARIRSLQLGDYTGFRGDDAGSHTLYVDALDIQ